MAGQPQPEALGELLNGADLLLARHAPGQLALQCGDARMSYGELRQQVARTAAVWQARGLRPGGRLVVRLPDGFDWVLAWLGALWAGGVAVGVSPRIAATEWRDFLDESQFDVIVAETADDTPGKWRERVIDPAQLRRATAAALPVAPVPVSARAPGFWVQSSGTSGRPKSVVHRHAELRGIARVSAERLGLTSVDRLFSSSRLFFTYPLVNVLLAGLSIGATVLLDARWPNAASLVSSVEALRPTVLFSVPSLYRDMLHGELAARVRDAGVRCCVSAGEALPHRLRSAWQQASGLPMIDGYGTSETLVLVLAGVPGDDGLLPSPGVRVRPLDPVGAAAGAPTRLHLQVATLALGYYQRPKAQAESFRDDGFCPSDLFVQTAGGGWAFAGREDSLVKIRGRWVDLAGLEEHLSAGLSGRPEVAAVCVPDADGVDAIALFVVAEGGSDASGRKGDGRAGAGAEVDTPIDAVREQLREHIAALPPHQRPAWVLPIDALPRTATGKLMRRKLVERFPSLCE